MILIRSEIAHRMWSNVWTAATNGTLLNPESGTFNLYNPSNTTVAVQLNYEGNGAQWDDVSSTSQLQWLENGRKLVNIGENGGKRGKFDEKGGKRGKFGNTTPANLSKTITRTKIHVRAHARAQTYMCACTRARTHICVHARART